MNTSWLIGRAVGLDFDIELYVHAPALTLLTHSKSTTLLTQTISPDDLGGGWWSCLRLSYVLPQRVSRARTSLDRSDGGSAGRHEPCQRWQVSWRCVLRVGRGQPSWRRIYQESMSVTSWYCDGKSDKPRRRGVVGAFDALYYKTSATVDGAHYHAVYVRPEWASTKTVVGDPHSTDGSIENDYDPTYWSLFDHLRFTLLIGRRNWSATPLEQILSKRSMSSWKGL